MPRIARTHPTARPARIRMSTLSDNLEFSWYEMDAVKIRSLRVSPFWSNSIMVELDFYIKSKSASASFKEEGLQVSNILSFFHLCFPSILRITTLTMFSIPSIPEDNPSDTLAHFFWRVENCRRRVKYHLECRNVHIGIEEIYDCNVC